MNMTDNLLKRAIRSQTGGLEVEVLRFRSLAIFNFLPSLPSHILHLPSMQDQVVERPEQLQIDQIKRSTIRSILTDSISRIRSHLITTTIGNTIM
jgi:hypothetical protein